MSYESKNTLDESTRLQEVMALIELLGYRRYLVQTRKGWAKLKKELELEVYGSPVITYNFFLLRCH